MTERAPPRSRTRGRGAVEAKRPATTTLEATITELSPGGDGVAIATLGKGASDPSKADDGERRAIFTRGVIRGERVRLAVDTTSRPARAEVLDVLEPSPARRTPPCVHFARCGACDWMHMTEAEQAVEHRRIVAKILRVAEDRIVIHRAPAELAYRTRTRLHVDARGKALLVGLHGRRSHEPVAVDVCIVLDPVLERIRKELGGWLEGASGRGEAQLALGAPASASTHRRGVIELRWKGELPPAVFGRIERAIAEPGSVLAGARIFAGEVRVPATIGDPTPFLVAADGAPLKLAPGGFSQATEAGNARLAARVAELARGLGDGACVELHAGAGNLTVLLAKDRPGQVVAVERDADACASARQNLAARALEGRIVEGDASTFVIPKATRLVVLDPPREGADSVAKAIASRGPRQLPDVLYVSCDPPTLARDVRTLEATGYVIETVEIFEMFPQTSHVETVVVLRPPAPGLRPPAPGRETA